MLERGVFLKSLCLSVLLGLNRQVQGLKSLSVSSRVSCEAQRSLGLGQGLSRREQAACQAAGGHPGAGLSHALGCGCSEASPASTWTCC